MQLSMEKPMQTRILRCLLLCPFIVVFVTTIEGLAQAPSGIPPFSTWNDEVNLPNLALLFRIPVRTKPGTLPFSYDVLLDNYFQRQYPSPTGVPSVIMGASFQGRVGGARQSGLLCPDRVTRTTVVSNYQYTDFHNTVHTFSNIVVDTAGCLDGTTAQSFADDNSRYFVSVDTNNCAGPFYVCSLYDKFGDTLDRGNSIKDPNGYALSLGVPGNGI
jgi:hypothetical protein